MNELSGLFRALEQARHDFVEAQMSTPMSIDRCSCTCEHLLGLQRKLLLRLENELADGNLDDRDQSSLSRVMIELRRDCAVNEQALGSYLSDPSFKGFLSDASIFQELSAINGHGQCVPSSSEASLSAEESRLGLLKSLGVICFPKNAASINSLLISSASSSNAPPSSIASHSSSLSTSLSTATGQLSEQGRRPSAPAPASSLNGNRSSNPSLNHSSSASSVPSSSSFSNSVKQADARKAPARSSRPLSRSGGGRNTFYGIEADRKQQQPPAPATTAASSFSRQNDADMYQSSGSAPSASSAYARRNARRIEEREQARERARAERLEQQQGYQDEQQNASSAPSGFKTAYSSLPSSEKRALKRKFQAPDSAASSSASYKHSGNSNKRKVGAKAVVGAAGGRKNKNGSNDSVQESENPLVQELLEDERCKNVDAVLLERICNEILSHSAPVHWDDIAGLSFAKTQVQEIVIWPLLKPELFSGLREPPKGLLLFGPPGTGKTLIGRAIATEANSTFFSISASSLTSKWVGEGEKMVRALFAVARCLSPAVVFVDEIDSLLTSRSDSEQEASRRIKTEFLVQMEGCSNGPNAAATADLLLIVGATNRPQELDEAVRRRMTKRLYIPLPTLEARVQLISRLLDKDPTGHSVTEDEVQRIAKQTRGFSGADVTSLCKEAAMGPIRSISMQGSNFSSVTKSDLRRVGVSDFEDALKTVKPSVSSKDLVHYQEWNKEFGTWQESKEEVE